MEGLNLLSSLAEQYLEVRNKRDEARVLIEHLQERMDTLQEQVLTGLAMSGQQRFSAHGYTFAPRQEVWYSLPAELKSELLYRMANHPNFSDIVQPACNAQSLRKRVTDIVENQEQLEQSDPEQTALALRIVEQLKKTETTKLSVVSSGK